MKECKTTIKKCEKCIAECGSKNDMKDCVHKCKCCIVLCEAVCKLCKCDENGDILKKLCKLKSTVVKNV